MRRALWCGVAVASDRKEGVAAARSRALDIVVADPDMPGMDGIGFVRALRQRPPDREAPIVMIAAESDKGLKQQAKAAGPTGRLAKPFKPEQLHRRKQEDARMTSSADPVDIFRQEAGELLEQLEAALLDLERSPDDRNLINSAFRALHTIKGSGAMFGFDQVAAFAHEFESAFDRVRKGDAAPEPDLIAIALNAKDFLRTQIEKPEEANAVIGMCILSDLRKLVQGPGAPALAGVAPEPAAPPPPPPSERKAWRVGMRFHKDVLVNGSNPLLLLDELRTLGDCRVAVDVEATPPLDQMDPDRLLLHLERSARDRPSEERNRGRLHLRRRRHGAQHRGGRRAARHNRRVPSAIAAVAPPLAGGQPTREGAAKKGAKESATIRVQAERLDEMMDRVGELVIAQARLTQLAAAGANAKGVAEEIERLASSLRDTMMGIRMLPIGSLFGRFRRLVHDLSRDLGKEIELITEGEETELDKTMIERLADPLIHVIRNAVDHGLESAEARRAAGKDPVGHIRLVARHAGAEVLISVSDDGGGLNLAKIRAKAEENGLIAPGAVALRGRAVPAPLPARLLDRPARSRRCPAAASAWTWCGARSRACAARSTSPARPARARPSPCACR